MPDFHGAQEQPSSARDYRLSPRKVAMWSAVAAVAAVATLIAVAAVNDADALNTVALYLAVIAFVAQLIMYVAQNESSARQLKQSQDVQRQTSSMLSGIEKQAAGIERRLNEEYATVIQALVEQAAAATERLLAERGREPEAAAAPDQAMVDQLRDELREELSEAAAVAVTRYAEEQQVPRFPASGPPSSGVDVQDLVESNRARIVGDLANAQRKATAAAAARRAATLKYLQDDDTT
jgi:hypothetical protein